MSVRFCGVTVPPVWLVNASDPTGWLIQCSPRTPQPAAPSAPGDQGDPAELHFQKHGCALRQNSSVLDPTRPAGLLVKRVPERDGL